MGSNDRLIEEKLAQVPAILRDAGVDVWLIFVRESQTVHDPCLDLVVGTDVTWPSAFLLTSGGDRIAIVGSLDRANLAARGHFREIVPYVGGVSGALRDVLARLDPARIALDYSTDDPLADGLTHGMFLLLRDVLAGTPYASRLVSSQPVVSALRGRKSSEERERIRRACAITVGILEQVGSRLRAGLTERQVAEAIREAMGRVSGCEPAWDPEHCPAVFTGPDSAGAHAGPTDRSIEPGHIVSVDFGVRCDGYCSDLQRTWYVLRPEEQCAPESVRRGFDTIVEAITLAAGSLRPGARGCDVDQVARGLLVSRGYPEYAHGLGHQIGRAAHDGGGGLFPPWERYGRLPFLEVESGQCYTIEPRLPVAGHGVVTVEEVVAVGPAGADFLSTRQTELYLVG